MDEKLIQEQIEAMNRNSQALEENTTAMLSQANAERELANELATFRALLLSLAYAGEDRPSVTAGELLSGIDGLTKANEALSRKAPAVIEKMNTLSMRLFELWEELDKNRHRGGF